MAKTEAKERRKPRRTKRIYYGPPNKEKRMYWTVTVTDAKEPITFNGTIEQALKGHAGVTVGCAISYTCRENAKAFPHAVYLASITKTTALMVDRLNKAGQPTHAVIYEHSYPHIISWNDRRELKKMVKEDPSIMERAFTFRPPRKQVQGSGRNAGKRRLGSTRGMAFVPRGAMARAVEAGLMGEHVAEQLTAMA